jgi:hypothetical protein
MKDKLEKILAWLKKRTAKGCECQSCIDGRELTKEIEETLTKESNTNENNIK